MHSQIKSHFMFFLYTSRLQERWYSSFALDCCRLWKGYESANLKHLLNNCQYIQQNPTKTYCKTQLVYHFCSQLFIFPSRFISWNKHVKLWICFIYMNKSPKVKCLSIRSQPMNHILSLSSSKQVHNVLISFLCKELQYTESKRFSIGQGTNVWLKVKHFTLKTNYFL